MLSDNQTLGDADMQNVPEPFITATVVVETFVMIFGILGNMCLFLLMRQKRLSQQTFAVYLSFSAIFDSWFLFANGLLDAMETFSLFDWDQFSARTWTCKWQFIFTSFPQAVVPWLIVVLTVDRFVSICLPQKAPWYNTKAKAAIISSAVAIVGFIITFAIGMHEEAVMNRSTDGDNGTVQYDCRSNLPKTEAGSFIRYILLNFMPLVILSVLNLKIFLRLLKTNGYAFVSEEQVPMVTEKARLERINGIVFYALVMNVVTFLPFCVVEMVYIPFETYGNISDEMEYHLDKAWHVTLVIYMVTFAQNFYIMMALSRMMRSEFAAMVCRVVCCTTTRPENDVDAVDDVDLDEMNRYA